MSAKNKKPSFLKSLQPNIRAAAQISHHDNSFKGHSRRPPQNPVGNNTGPDHRALEKEARQAKKAALRAKKAALRNVRETFKQLPGTSGGRRTRRNTRRARK